MRRSTLVFASVLLMVLMAATALPLHAQFRASLRGTVSDPSGAVVPGATVTLINKGTNETRQSTTDDNGIYVFNALPAAQFKLSVERQGFKTKSLENVQIIPDQLNSLNLAMEIGGTSENVTVSGTTQALDTETATVSSTISSNQIQHLPSFNRDVFQLAQLTPGVFGDASQSAGGGAYNLPGNQGPGGTGGGSGGIFQTENGPQLQNAGGQYETNSISIDGISTVSAVWGGTSIITPSEDSVQDMKVVSNNYDAEYGRFSGAQIQVTSKGGTNQFHGSLFFKASRPGLNAYQRWNGPGSDNPGTPAERGLQRDNNRFNQYGGSIGGPIWKNKIFFFFNVETSPNSSTQTSQGWYETPQFAALAGGPIATQYLGYPGAGVNASALVNRTCESVGLVSGVNCNQVTGGLDVGSPLTNGVGNQDPTFGVAGTPNGIGGGFDGIPDIGFFNTTNPTDISQTQYNGRLDANLTSNDRLAFAIYWVPTSSTSYNGPVRSMNLWHHQQINDAFSITWDHTFSPTLLNQARANAAGWRWNEITTNGQEPFGLAQANIDAYGSMCNDGCFQYLGAPGPSNFNQWTYTYSDVLTKVWGRHNVKVGGELTRLYYLNNPVYSARPGFTFHNVWDFLNDAPYAESGQFDSATGVPFANRQDNRQNIWGFFVQDDFKIKPNLTLNIGLRYSYFGSYHSKQNNLDVLQFGSSSDPLGGMNIRVGGDLYTPQKNNFGPQLGFAWSPTRFDNKLVFRGGFGVSYNQNEIAITANGNGNPPNAVQAAFNCGPTDNQATCQAAGVLYETANNINSLFGFNPNPAAITTFGSNNLPTGAAGIQVTGYPSEQKTITVYHYSLDMQYELPYNNVVSLGYMGNLGRHLLTQSNYNVIAAYKGLPLNPVAKVVDFYDNNGNSNYNGMVAALNHRFSHQFQLAGQYTWAKAMDENSGPYSMDPYPYDPHLAYGRSDYNVQNAFKLWGLWQPVIFRGEHNWMEKILGGWSISGIWNIHSGLPWNPNYGTPNGIYYNGSWYGNFRPVAIVPGFGVDNSNSVYMGQTNPNFNGNATTYFPATTYGGAPTFPSFAAGPVPGIQRNSLTGPGYNDVDATLTKAFGLPNNRILGEGARLEVRADFYNLFNKININPGSINSFLGSVNPDGTLSPNSGFGVAGSALGSRTVQLQARFSF